MVMGMGTMFGGMDRHHNEVFRKGKKKTSTREVKRLAAKGLKFEKWRILDFSELLDF